MNSKFRRCLGAIAIALVVTASVPGCSQPIDPNSSVPAALQPLVLIIAAVGVGIGITALDHHNQNHSSSAPTPALATPSFVGSVGNQPFDLAIDLSVPGSVGILGSNGGAGMYGFTEEGSSATNAGSYTLPAGYQPVVVTVDGVGNDWFDDSGGNVDECAPPTSTPRTCVPTLAFKDGLGSGGVRAMTADSTHIFIAYDNRSGTVNWAAYFLDGTNRVTGSYQYTGLGIYTKNAAVAEPAAVVGTYIIFHQDGTSWTVPLPGPASKNTSTFTPVPLGAGNVAFDGSSLFYGLLGSLTSGAYEIGRWVGPATAFGNNPGTLAAKITIGFNGQTSTRGAAFRLPVSALATDGSYIYMLDSSGNLVLFSAF
jgi:hypothetical protein